MKNHPDVKHYVIALEMKIEILERGLKELAKTDSKAFLILNNAARVSGIPVK